MTDRKAIRQASILVTVLLTEEIITGKEAEILREALEQPSDIEAAVRAENEACAKLADSISDKYAFGYYGNEVDTADEIAAAIRERAKS